MYFSYYIQFILFFTLFFTMTLLKGNIRSQFCVYLKENSKYDLKRTYKRFLAFFHRISPLKLVI